MRVLLGVTGGIAAYKVALVLRRLVEDGHSVRVIPTPASLEFVGRATWEALSGHPAPSSTFDDIPSVQHVRLGQRADAVLIAPATADFLAGYAHGEARDLLGNALLATGAPVVVAPAMHTEMWLHPATQANVETLRARGVTVLEPAVGRLTGPDSGPGRLPEPDHIVAAFYAAVSGAGGTAGGAIGAVGGAEANPVTDPATARGDERESWGDLDGLRILITAGGTHEPLDPVRYLGNRSTGHQGFALAEAARERGAQVTVIAANVQLPASEGVTRVDVTTAAELEAAVRERESAADVIIMAAAVADFTPAQVSEAKIKKHGDGSATLELVATPDILRGIVARRVVSTVVGFAAETGDEQATAAEHARAKARAKGAHLLVFNEVGPDKGFGDVPNSVRILGADGAEVSAASGSKLAVAHAVLDAIVALRSS